MTESELLQRLMKELTDAFELVSEADKQMDQADTNLVEVTERIKDQCDGLDDEENQLLGDFIDASIIEMDINLEDSGVRMKKIFDDSIDKFRKGRGEEVKMSHICDRDGTVWEGDDPCPTCRRLLDIVQDVKCPKCDGKVGWRVAYEDMDALADQVGATEEEVHEAVIKERKTDEEITCTNCDHKFVPDEVSNK